MCSPDPFRPWPPAALFTTGMALREQGQKTEALSRFQQVYARDPGFGPATDALRSPAYRLVITSATDIDARIDPWTPTHPPRRKPTASLRRATPEPTTTWWIRPSAGSTRRSGSTR